MATGTYDSGDVQITFTADLSTEDVGGELKVIETFVDNIEVDSVTILGVLLKTEEYKALPKSLRDAIEDRAKEVEFEE